MSRSPSVFLAADLYRYNRIAMLVLIIQAKRIYRPGVRAVLTGGLCECDYICEALSKELKTEVTTLPEARFAGAIGAALLAM